MGFCSFFVKTVLESGFILGRGSVGFTHKIYVGASNGAHKHHRSLLRNLYRVPLTVSIKGVHGKKVQVMSD